MKVAQSCATLCNPMDYTVDGVLQARILEWVAFPLLQWIFPTQELNQGLLHCRQTLYQLSCQGSPWMRVEGKNQCATKNVFIYFWTSFQTVAFSVYPSLYLAPVFEVWVKSLSLLEKAQVQLSGKHILDRWITYFWFIMYQFKII